MEHRDSPLSVDHVTEVFEACLAHGAASHPTVTVVGIVHTAAFSVDALTAHRAEIGGMLAQLPTEFLTIAAGGGGGWSFLNACMDRDNNQWTGEHRVMELLMLLGLGTGQVSYLMPREMWTSLPGAMPYLEVDPT